MNQQSVVFAFLLLVCFPMGLSSQSSTQNYVRSRQMTNTSGTGYLERIDYFDGLGRLSQRIESQMGGGGEDLVSLYEYDGSGRLSQEWLPASMAGNNGAYAPASTLKSSARSSHRNDSRPYVRNTYEASPLDRVCQVEGAGELWHNAGRSDRVTYWVNSSAYPCGRYSSSDDGFSVSLTRSGTYPAGMLWVVKTEDEDNTVRFRYEDKEGRLMLERTMNGSVCNDTYYVYDSYGNLRAVVPPLASDALSGNGTYGESDTALEQYCYLYKYDARNRCVGKKLPGCDWIYYVYDRADRLVFMQDGVLRGSGKWRFTLADPFGRVVLTGSCTNTLNYASNPLGGVTVNTVWSNSTSGYLGYIVSGVTLLGAEVESVYYYDRYEFIGMNGVPTSMTKGSRPGYPSTTLSAPIGQVTGAVFRHLGTPDYQYESYYYDSRCRLVQIRRTHHLGGSYNDYVQPSFDGLSEKRFHEQSVSGVTRTQEYLYSYDQARRPLQTTHRLNGGGGVLLSEKGYDHLGRLKSDRKGGVDSLKSTYGYDVRSRMIENAQYGFTQRLNYSFGGNILSEEIQNGPLSYSYHYSYDGLCRLTAARYEGEGDFSTSYGYDKHGNPQSIVRQGISSTGVEGLLDDLRLSYHGNRLKKVTDAASGSMSSGHDFLDFSDHQNEYLYDGNGNLTKDLNRGVSQIQYNVLNLPIRIDIKNPLSEARNEYLYRSDGEKSRVIHRWNPNYSVAPVIGSGISESSLTMSDTTDYVGTFEYEGGVLKRIETENGYIEDGRYVYYVRDHLGSIRRLSSHRVGSEGLNYYPYGMLWRSEGALSEQRYLYTGKEYDRMHGLNLYDYGARFYDPSLGRFTTVDPMAEKYYSLSPYVYCGNNPTRFIDPSGMSYGEPEKSKRQLISEMLEVMKDLVEGFTYQLGVHPAQLQSEDAKIREDATQKREHALQVMNTVNESMLSPIPFGEIAYKKATDQEISSHSMVWEVAGILPIGKIGKAAKGGWKVGEPITNLTAKGNVPAWSTVRQRFWKNEAFFNGSPYSKSNLLRMQKGLAPQFRNTITGVTESMELHHIIPQRNGGLFEFIKIMPEQHRLIDPFRR